VSVIPPVEGIKIISCRPRHADALQSTPVAHDREGHDFRETKRCEGVPKRGRCSFAGVAAPPALFGEPPTDFDAWREVRFFASSKMLSSLAGQSERGSENSLWQSGGKRSIIPE
jgi:hypothetical protein